MFTIKLMNRNVPVVLLKVLINWYDKCAVFVRWNNVLSRCFDVLMFCFFWYVVWDKGECYLLSCFQYMLMIWYRSFVKSLGCYVGDVYCSCVVYADDLIPVSASVNLLQRMTDTCCEEAV